MIAPPPMSTYQRALAFTAALTVAVLPQGLAEASCIDDTEALTKSTTDMQKFVKSWSAMDVLLISDDLSNPPDDFIAQDLVGGQPEHLPDRWNAVVDAALQEFDAVARQCTPTDLVSLSGANIHSDVFVPATPVEALSEYSSRHGVSSNQLSAVLSAPGGVPSPQALQLSMSQITSAGQPGIVPVVAGNPLRRSDSSFLRHWSINASGVVLQPTSGISTQTTVSSISVWSGVVLEDSAYDWYRLIGDKLGIDEAQYDERRASALRTLLAAYRASAENYVFKSSTPLPPLSQVPDSDRADALRAARNIFEQAHSVTQSFFHASTAAYLQDHYIAPVEGRAPKRMSLSLVGRLSPEPSFVQELPDLLNVAVAWQGKFQFKPDSQSTSAAIEFDAAAAYSAYPTTSPDVSVEACDDFTCDNPNPAVLVDLSVGFHAALPSPVSSSIGRTRVDAAVLGRGASRSGSVAGLDASGGCAIAMEIPVTDSLAIAGTYVGRAVQDGSDWTWIGTTGVSLAAVLAN